MFTRDNQKGCFKKLQQKANVTITSFQYICTCIDVLMDDLIGMLIYKNYLQVHLLLTHESYIIK